LHKHRDTRVHLPQFRTKRTSFRATARNFTGGHVENTRILDVRTFDEVDAKMYMVGTVSMLLQRANKLLNYPFVFFADTLDVAIQVFGGMVTTLWVSD